MRAHGLGVPIEIEYPACPACRAGDGEAVYQFPTCSPQHIVRCGSCRYLFLSPNPDEIEMLRTQAHAAAACEHAAESPAALFEDKDECFWRAVEALCSGVGRSVLDS
jgi:hypothetical protein